MHRPLTLLLLTALLVPTAFAATVVDDGTVPKRTVETIAALLGDYEGQWDSELTENVYDDISPL